MEFNDMRQSSAEAKLMIAPHIVCLMMGEKTDTKIAGTGLFVALDGGQYVISAGHVLGNTGDIGFFVAPRERCILGCRTVSWDEGRKHSRSARNGPLDVGIARVPLGSSPLGKFPYPLTGTESSVSMAWEGMWIGGFPSAAITFTPNGIETTLFQCNTYEADVRWASWDPYDNETHLALNFPAHGFLGNSGESIDVGSLNPTGMSGAPVWGLRKLSDDGPARGKWHFHLVGILQSAYEKGLGRYLVATRIEAFLKEKAAFGI